jgi:uncharacterized membrane protein
MINTLRKWFLTGLLIAAPVVITMWLVWSIVSFADHLLQAVLPHDYQLAILLGYKIPGIGLILTLLVLLLLGALFSNLFGQFFIRQWDRLVARVPVISGIYGAIKQVLNSVLSEQGQSFREVVYVEYPQPGQYALGFVTGAAESFPDMQEEMVAVFIPLVPVMTSGNWVTLPKSKLIATDITVEEGLKLVVTLGLVKKELPGT